MTIQELRNIINELDPDMEVRVIGSGPLLASYLAVSREARGVNMLLLSAIEASDALDLSGGGS